MLHEPRPGAPPSPPDVDAAARGTPVPRSAGGWTRVRAHLFAQFWLKAVGTTAFMWLFFAGYFHLLRHPTRAAFEMPLTGFDAWLGFHPWALWPYISLWVYVVIPPSLMPDARTLVRYGWWVGGLCVAGLACFYCWPTAVPSRALSADGHAGFQLLRGVDAAGNACPSMHVAAATFSALWIHRLVRTLALPAVLRAVNAAWFALIVWSTLATQQHVWWDVVAGLALALVVTPASLRLDGTARRSDIMAPHWNRNRADGGS
jgi:PAP2 superfamily